MISDTYYHKMLLTQQQLPVRCEICCEFIFLRMGETNCLFHQACGSNTQIWTQWTIKFAQKFSSGSASEKNHNVNGHIGLLWYGRHGYDQRIINNATDEWCKRLWVKVCWEKLQQFYCKFLAESKVERIVKIVQYFAKLWTNNIVVLFWLTVKWLQQTKYISTCPIFVWWNNLITKNILNWSISPNSFNILINCDIV